MPGGCTVKDVDQGDFVKALAVFFKSGGKMKIPDWVDLVKLGIHKELAPYDQDWFYTRAGKCSLTLKNSHLTYVIQFVCFICLDYHQVNSANSHKVIKTQAGNSQYLSYKHWFNVYGYELLKSRNCDS